MRNKTKIALIQLPYYKSTNSAVIPLGLIMLGTVAEQNGFRAEIVDLDLLVKQGRLNTTSKFFKSAAKRILDSGADILGFSPLCHSFPAALLVAKECKNISPETMIVFGGPEASFQCIETLKLFSFVDLIIRGEGERVIVEVLEAVKTGKEFKNIRGITYREKKKIVKNADQDLIHEVDALPYPNYSLHPAFKNSKSISRLVETIPVEGGRGCPYSCTFCSTRQTWRGRFRLKSPRRLADEIKYVQDNYAKNIPIEIIHDNFTVNRKALLQFCRYVPKGTIWRINSRIDLLDKTVIQKLSQSGCDYMLIGIESGSPYIQKSIRKNLDLEQAYKNILLVNQSKITPRYTFMMGFPQERAEDLDKTINFALRCACLMNESNVQLNLLALTAPCSLYQELGPASLAEPDPSALTHITISRITNSRREWNFIKRHKSYFPVYFLVKSDYFETQYLFKMNVLFTFLTQHLPLTTRAALTLLSLTPVEFADKVIPYFERFGPRRLGLFWMKNKFRLEYLKIIRKYIKSIKKENIRELLLTIFKHEASIIKTIMSSNWEQEKNLLPKTLDLLKKSRPRLSRGVRFKKYNYDLNHLIDSIQAETRIEAPATTKMNVAYVPQGSSGGSLPLYIGYSASALKLSPLAQLLIKLCDGRSTVNEIARKVHSLVEEISFKEFSRACNKKISYLIEQGVLYTDEK